MNLYERPAQKLNKGVIIAWMMSEAVEMGLCLAISAYLIFAFFETWWLVKLVAGIGLVVLLLQCTELFLKQLRWKNWGFDVGSDSVEIMEGVFFVRRTMIPLSAVEYVDTTQGPIERLFQLYSLRLATAAGTHRIPGLVRDQAESLRTHVRLKSKLKDG